MTTANATPLDDAIAARQRGNYAHALKIFKSLAAHGDAKAQYNLGLMYENGQGVTQDYKEAVKWCRLAADQGLAEAQYNLGLIYRDGEGVTQDYKETVKWYRLAADQGFAEAQYNLGLMYRYAYGVLQDYTSAHMWLNLASAGGSVLATEMRDKVTKLMTPQQIEKEQDMARAYQEKNFKGC